MAKPTVAPKRFRPEGGWREDLILESGSYARSTENLPPGVLCRVEYLIANLGKKNRNERIYTWECFEHTMSRKEVQERLGARRLFGNCEHPKESPLRLEPDKTSHIVTEFKRAGDKVKQVIEVLDTAAGKFIDVLLKAGCGVGVSTRADGELEEAIDEKGEKYFKVVPDAYDYITTDFTGDPSTIGTSPENVQRALVASVAKEWQQKHMAKNICHALLESASVPEAKALLTEVDKEEELAVEAPVPTPDAPSADAPPVEPAPVDSPPVDPEAPAEPLAAEVPPVAPSEPTPPPDTGSQEVANIVVFPAGDGKFGWDAVLQRVKGGSGFDTEQAAKDDARTAMMGLQSESKFKFVDMRLDDVLQQASKLIESSGLAKSETVLGMLEDVARLSKTVLSEQVQSATAKAERDKLLELIESATQRVTLAQQSFVSDNMALTEKLETAKTQVLEHQSKLSLESEVNSKLSESVAALNKQLDEAKVASESAAKKATEAHENAISELKSQQSKLVLAAYAKSRITLLRTKLTESHRALLAACKSETEVDKVVADIRLSLQEGALHSGGLKGVTFKQNVTPATNDKEVQTITRAFESMNPTPKTPKESVRKL